MSETRRRPSGEKPPLPKEFSRSDVVWLVICILAVVILAIIGALNRSSDWLDHMDAILADEIVALRTTVSVDVARAIAGLASPGPMQALTAALALGLVILRRTRRLVVLLVTLFTVYAIQALITGLVQRPRPGGIEILGGWAGYSFPSDSVTALVAIAFAGCFAYFPRGIRRRIAGASVLGAGIAVGLAQVVLGVDHPTDVIAGVMLATAVALSLFRSLVPDALFPVVRRGNTAHLEITGIREAAIKRALKDQLGIDCKAVKPFGLAGSSGSTPMLVTGATASETYFAKLYSTSHVRSDLIYKLYRTLRFGRLEDEVGFRSVRRIVEYEDYMMRLMAEAGVPVVKTYGIVEITPEREYLLVTDFATGASEMGDLQVEIGDEIIDACLESVRLMWDAGLSHRDLKPSNLLVRGSELIVIDVAFGSVRPSPWRQAVDLACAMLVLALKTDSARVYERSLRIFSEDEIAEAAAAAGGGVIPGQLRAMLRSDERDLLAELKALSGEANPIRIQRWSIRRVGLLILVMLGAAIVTLLILETVVGPDRGVVKAAECPDSPTVVLAAQAVPGAEKVPCIEALSSGWSLNETVVTNAGLVSVYDNDKAGSRAMVLKFADSCSPSEFSQHVSGGCADVTFSDRADEEVVREGNSMIGWVDRSQLGPAAQTGPK